MSDEGLDTSGGLCPNIGSFGGSYSARGASSARRHDPRDTPPMLTAEDIARLTGAPLRTVRERLRRWHRDGGPVVQVAREGRGRRPWAVSATDYARRVGVEVEALHG